MTEAYLSNAMNAYGPTVYRLALCRMQNTADAEDVYQEVFLRLWKQDAEDWEGERLKAWLIRTALNRCADLHRFRLRRPVLALEDLPELVQPDDEAAFSSALSPTSVRCTPPSRMTASPWAC